MEGHTGRLIYVVGPSGAGKDALLEYARAHLPPGTRMRFARRRITRPADTGSEHHVPLTRAEFDDLVKAGQFAMHWRAHGNGYGIDAEIRDWLRNGDTVVVSGSREYLPQALADFPDLSVVCVTVRPEILRERLQARGRESAAEIEERLGRTARFPLPAGVSAVEVRNDGSLEEGGEALLRALLGNRA